MTNNELMELKTKVVKSIRIRSAICIFSYTVIYVLLIGGSIVYSNYEINESIFIISILSLVFLSFIPLFFMLYKNFKDETSFTNIKIDEYKNRVLYDQGLVINKEDIKSNKDLKISITNQVKDADIIRGSIKIYNALSFNSDEEIIKRYEVSINKNNGNNNGKIFKGYVYVLNTPKLVDINLKAINFKSYSYQYKKLTKESPFVSYNKAGYPSSEDVPEVKQNKILKLYDLFVDNEKPNIDRRSLYGVTIKNDTTYLYISKSKTNKFTKVTDFGLDYNRFTKEIENVYKVNNYISEFL